MPKPVPYGHLLIVWWPKINAVGVCQMSSMAKTTRKILNHLSIDMGIYNKEISTKGIYVRKTKRRTNVKTVYTCSYSIMQKYFPLNTRR